MMTMDRDNDHESHLDLVAGAVADLEAVDWRLAESSAPEEHRPLIRILEVISGVAKTHQHEHGLGSESAVTELTTWGPLQIIEKVGEGVFGEVFRARDPQLDRDVALKLFYPDRYGHARPAKELIEEGRLLARVRNSNVAVVHGAEQHDSRVGIWMEFIDGCTLEEYVGVKGTLDPDETMTIGRDICRALTALHDAKVVHRDIKARNVMREKGGRIVVLDLGASRDTTRLDSGRLYGTPFYAAPEVLTRNESSSTSDIYSVGVLLFYLLTGQYPVTGLTVGELREAHVAGQVKQLRELRPDLQESLIRIVEKALAPEPVARFTTARQFEQALTDALEAKEETRRARVTWLSLAAMAVLVACVAAVWIWGPWRLAPAPLPGISPKLIAVAPLKNRTGNPAQDAFGMLASDAIIQRFVKTGAAETVLISPDSEPPSGIGAVGVRAPPADRLLEAARRKGAAYLLSGACYLDDGMTRLQANLADCSSGELIYTFDSETTDQSATSAGIAALAEQVVAAVAAHLDPWIDISVMRPPASYEVFLLYQRGIELWDVDYDAVISWFRRALELDPDFHTLRTWIAMAYSNVLDLEKADEALDEAEKYVDQFTPFERADFRRIRATVHDDRVAALNETRQMAKLAPHLPWVCHNLANYALDVNRPREAIEALTPYVSSYAPPNVKIAYWGYDMIAAAYHFVGDYERQIEYADLGLDRFPDVASLYRHKAAALAAMGQVEAVKQVVDDLVRSQARGWHSTGQVMIGVASELSYHGHPEAAAEMATRAVEWFERRVAESGREAGIPDNLWSYTYALRLAGRWQEAREALSELEETGWRAVDVKGGLGVIAAQLDDRQEAQRVFEELRVSESRYFAASRLYWRACIAAHLDEKDRAMTLLSEAFARGLKYTTSQKPAHDYAEWPLHSDLDLEPLWHHPPFEKLIEPQG